MLVLYLLLGAVAFANFLDIWRTSRRRQALQEECAQLARAVARALDPERG
jgi:hypothetical protein